MSDQTISKDAEIDWVEIRYKSYALGTCVFAMLSAVLLMSEAAHNPHVSPWRMFAGALLGAFSIFIATVDLMPRWQTADDVVGRLYWRFQRFAGWFTFASMIACAGVALWIIYTRGGSPL